MEDFQIVHEKESIRLFQSDFLEFFTHINPAVIVAIWLPFCLIMLVNGMVMWPSTVSTLVIPLIFVLGLFFWTFTEYMMHRFVFHFHPRSESQKRIIFLFHGIHHAQPQDKTRLVMPPVVSVPLALVVYALIYVVIGKVLGLTYWVNPMISGFSLGYLSYDLIHYATHHFAMRGRVSKYLKRYHMQHHYKTPSARFGVSSPLWDVVFCTKPK
jgi:sterol desaturase/sphingolipid hydroxylase (fatty acid hydroxylase superfamily)